MEIDYIYRLELLKESPTSIESKVYIKFMEEAGVECVSTYVAWVFFRKKASEGIFDLYSDYDSRIKHYKRVSNILIMVVIVNFISAMFNLITVFLIGSERGIYSNVLYVSVISWVIIIIFFLPVIISYSEKIHKMKKEKQLYE